MDEYDDLGTYNGDPAHDINVDYDYYINTGTPDYFDDSNSDDDNISETHYYGRIRRLRHKQRRSGRE